MSFINVNLPGAQIVKLPRRCIALTNMVANGSASAGTASKLGPRIVGVVGGGVTITTQGAYLLGYLEIFNNSGGISSLAMSLTIDGRLFFSFNYNSQAANSVVVAVDAGVTGPIYSKSNIIITASASVTANLGYALQQLESA